MRHIAVAYLAALSLSFLASDPTALRAQDAATPDTQSATTDTLWTSSLKDLSDTPQAFSQWKGKVTLVYFWATWCAPCHKEAPHLSKIYERMKDKDVTVVGIGIDNAEKVRDFVAKYDLKNPTLYGGQEAVQLGRDLGNSLGAIPFAVIIGRDGKIAKTIRGDAPEGEIEGILSSLLG
jgi:thiol-disulfide isomerase/thioredoxin